MNAEQGRVAVWPGGVAGRIDRRIPDSAFPAQADGGVVSQEVIRPAAVLSEPSARLILAGLERDDVRSGGRWWAQAGMWRRYNGPWGVRVSPPGDSTLLGSISCVYDSPARFCVTVFRVSLTAAGLLAGWSTEALCNEAFAHAGLTLADCPRVSLSAPPRPFDPRARDVGPPRN